MAKNYYEILEVEPDASEKEIKQAYYRLARELHPDKAENERKRKKHEAIFADVSKAYNILKDKRRRAEYDKNLKKKVFRKKSQEPEKKVTESPPPKKASPRKESREARQDRSREKLQIAKKAYLKGLRFFKVGDYERAIPYFEAAVENDDSEGTYYYRLAMAYTKSRKKFTKAVEFCNRAIEIDPYNMDYKLLLGEIYELIGGLDKARNIYEEIMKWDPTHEKTRQKLQMVGSGGKGSKSFFGSLLKKLKGK